MVSVLKMHEIELCLKNCQKCYFWDPEESVKDLSTYPRKNSNCRHTHTRLKIALGKKQRFANRFLFSDGIYPSTFIVEWSYNVKCHSNNNCMNLKTAHFRSWFSLTWSSKSCCDAWLAMIKVQRIVDFMIILVNSIVFFAFFSFLVDVYKLL